MTKMVTLLMTLIDGLMLFTEKFRMLYPIELKMDIIISKRIVEKAKRGRRFNNNLQ